MDINNVSTFITLDPSKLFNAEGLYQRAMVMYEGDEDLVESFLKENLSSDSLAYAMHLLEETSSTSYMGVKIHYNGTSFSAPTAGVYGVKSRPEIKARIKAKVLKRNEQQNKAASLRKEDRWQDDDGDGKWYEKSDVDGKTSKREKEAKKKKKGHNCASKVKHEEYGMGDCVREMHTLDDDGNVTHYDVMFESKIIENIPVSELEIIEGMYHEHYVNEGKNKVNFTPHKMIDPSTKKEYRADTYEQHKKYKQKGYVHEQHKIKNCGCGQDPCVTYGKKKVDESNEVEVVSELKTSTLRNYVNKASIEAVGRGVDAGIKGMTGTKDEMEKNMTKAYKRQRGINRAANKLASRAERKEEVELDERLGGKGYKPYTSLTGKKVSGDWEDSDRGAGNKAKKRAGGKVEKKSPTYLAHVHNKEEVEVEVSNVPEGGCTTRKDQLVNVSEEGYDRWRDDRLVKYGIGHDGSDRKPSQPAPKSKVKGKTVLQRETEKKYGKGKTALDIVKAKITAKHGKGAIMSPKKEEVENLDELKSTTLLSYSNKAANELAFKGDGSKKAQKRATGVKRAAGQLTMKAINKEEVENDIPNLRARAEETECCSICGSYKHTTSECKKVKKEAVAPPAKEDSKVKRQNMLKRQVLMKKLQAVRAGGGADVVASYQPEGELVTDEYTVTNADKKGNTKAWQNYKAGKKNVKTGKPLYKAADHVKEDSDLDTKFSEIVSENSSLEPQSKAIDVATKNMNVKGKKKGNVLINPEVKTNVDESMENQKDNLQEVDLNTRSVDYGQEIKNAEPIKKKKPLKDFKKLAGAAAKNKKLG